MVRRSWARSGEDDPGSIQARIMSSPVRVVVTVDGELDSVTAPLRGQEGLDKLVQSRRRLKTKLVMEQRPVARKLAYCLRLVALG
jgi:hypothetical protein